MELSVIGPGRLRGELRPPGDKSLSHRGAILGAVAGGRTLLQGFLPAEDTLATLSCLQDLGVEIERHGGSVLVRGRRLRTPGAPLDCVRSGTTMRLLAGLLAGQPFPSILTGHPQLLARPMERVAAPLGRMGAEVATTDGRPPIHIQGHRLRGASHDLPIASAQVKSCLLLAGLEAEGETEVQSPAASRDHTERMLRAMGATIEFDARRCRLRPNGVLEGLDLEIAGDISSAAPFLAAAALLPGSRLVLRRVGINPTRSGFLEALKRMGARVEVLHGGEEHGEPWADLEVRSGELRAIAIETAEVPSLIDELPLLAVVASQADGFTRVSGAGELRVKETDRIAEVVRGLRKLGAEIEEAADGFAVRGPTRLHGVAVSSAGDHRLAMALAVAGLAASGRTIIDDVACVADSYPGFLSDFERSTGGAGG